MTTATELVMVKIGLPHTHLDKGFHLGSVVQFQQSPERPHDRKHKQSPHIATATLFLLHSWEQTLKNKQERNFLQFH